MDDKDRLGAKLHDKEKAEEDRFVAEQERKALEKLRAQMASAAKGLCPRCGATLAKRALEGVNVESCPSCKGFWIDHGELDTLVNRMDEAAVTRWLRGFLPH
ncbi:MAG: zf-TFIIB domain-containing protein [Deltaproteobacteria bacterium]|nr:zf-TFIIB domain-containing protein [Deltaproteobacteria bacterium]